MSNIKDRAKIVVGSTFEFTLYLIDEDGRPVSLTPFTSGNIVFCNARGTRTAIPLTIPGLNPDRGQLKITGTATGADDKWANADVELIASGVTTVILLNNKFEIVKRNCPPA